MAFNLKNWKHNLFNNVIKDKYFLKIDTSHSGKRKFKILKAFYTNRRQYNDKNLCLAVKHKGETYFLSYWGQKRFIYKENAVDLNAEYQIGMKRL